MKNKTFLNRVSCGDSLELLSRIEKDSIDIVFTDPPYFLDKLDNDWEDKKVQKTKDYYIIKSLPAGMKFDREQGKKFYQWYLQISKLIYKILKPGGFFFSFSSPRLYHRLASAIDDAKFEIRDCFIWLYTQNQAKAMSLNHFIDKMKITEQEKEKLKNKFEGWKTPQLKSCFEPIVMAQKPTQKTYLKNMIEHNIGLVDTQVRVGDNMFPANVLTIENINEIIDKSFLIQKPTQKEKETFNNHKTVKPLAICEHILALTAFNRDNVVLDPFVGSGTTLLAAQKLDINYIGIDINQEYVEIAKKRLELQRLKQKNLSTCS